MEILIALEGFLTCLGLIVAIGVQNAFILKQGLKREYVLPVVLFCACSDTFLIILGTMGFGTVIASSLRMTQCATLLGAVFLIGYGFRSFRNVRKPVVLHLDKKSTAKPSLKKVLSLCFAFTYFNPHAYLDTVVILGSVAAPYSFWAQKLSFTLGAIMASFLWFFSLGYSARILSPFFQKKRSWQLLDIITGCIMWGIASVLLRGFFATL